VEFGLCAIFLMPLYIWTVIVGMDMKRLMQTNQVSRDAGHMYARWVDFSKAGNKDLIVRLASGMNMTRDGGAGVVILSRVMKIGASQCTAGGVALTSCTNKDQIVFIQRIVIGNKDKAPSKFGTPSDSILNSDGTIDAVDYLKNASAVSPNFAATLALTDGEEAFLSECWFESIVRDFPTLNNRGPVYARTIY
jgi:hypothetical protein